MRTSKILLALAATALTARGAAAQGPLERISLGVFGQYTKLSSDLRMDNVAGVGGRVGVSLYKWLGAEADINFGSTTATRAPNESITYRPFRTLLTLGVPLSDQAKVILGAGYVNSIYAGRSTANQYEDGIAGQVGIQLCGSGKWGFRADGLMDYMPSPNEQGLDGTSTNLGVRVGATYALRGTCGDAPPDWALKLSPAERTVPAGQSAEFTPSAATIKGKLIPMKDVTGMACTSSDNSVATVDNSAKVTAVKAGSATITCSGTWKKIVRNASARVVVPDWSFAVAPAAESREVGQSARFTATAKDFDGRDLGAAEWMAMPASVASVSNGSATCLAAGTARIMARKTHANQTKEGSATLTCTAPPAPPKVSIALDSTHFDFDRAVVKKAGMAVLQTVVDAAKRVPSLRISIEGHTDWYGDEGYNTKLADKRVTAVHKALTALAKKGKVTLNIASRSYGESCPVTQAGDPDPSPPRPRVSKANKAAQAPNRRVEIWQLLEGETGSPASCRPADQYTNRIPFTTIK
jgi:outer membrane protein OmpA-like peptidoglycan-associated protein